MEKLIDKNAALESVCHNCCCDPEECKRDNSYCADYMSILNLPTVEVVRGQWEQGDFYDYGDVCSICDWDSEINNCKWSYCPNYGAKKDLGEKTND